MIFRGLLLGTMIAGVSLGQAAQASFADVKRAFDTGQYFTAARMAFNDANHAENRAEKAMSYAWATHGLVKAGLDQSALYFFLKTIELQDRPALKKVLELAPRLMERTGSDLIRMYLSQYTRVEDYPASAKNAFYISQTKDLLLKGQYENAIKSASSVQKGSSFYPYALQMKATAEVMVRKNEEGLRDFVECARQSDLADDDRDDSDSALNAKWFALRKNASEDLRARCIAGQARIQYQLGNYDESDRLYDRIPKASFVWTDTLFEHAWSTFAKEEYNRTLGKLVSYKSPYLKFNFIPEVDRLVAQSYYSLCLYDDSLKVVNEAKKEYEEVMREVHAFYQTNKSNYRVMFAMGKEALSNKLHTDRRIYRFFNRFVRAPGFQSLALSQERIAAERIAIQRIDAARPETKTGITEGFPGFLASILDWRNSSIEILGGVYVNNSLIDYYNQLVENVEKINFLKIDILGQMKKKLVQPEEASSAERSRGNRIPVRRNDQMLWSFNGEFWNDEIGDYVFALDSECGKDEAK